MNKGQKIIYALVCTSLLTSCGQSLKETAQESSEAGTSTKNDTLSNSKTTSTETLSESTGQQKELKISSRCIGCGHCVRFAVSNFKMNYSTHKAEVTSQENISSSDVDNAIDRCPVGAISIS